MTDKKMIEARGRLAILQEQELWDEVLNVWDRGTACFAECKNVFGTIVGVTYTFNEMPELKAIKENFEADFNYIVYYGIVSQTQMGRMLALLFVDSYEDKWEEERQLLKEGIPTAYVWNLDYKFGENGSIGVNMAAGGLVRTA